MEFMLFNLMVREKCAAYCWSDSRDEGVRSFQTNGMRLKAIFPTGNFQCGFYGSCKVAFYRFCRL